VRIAGGAAVVKDGLENPCGYATLPMIIILKPHAQDDKIEEVIAEVTRAGCRAHVSRGEFRTIIGAIGEEGQIDPAALLTLDQVDSVVPIMRPYKLASREFHPADSVIEVGPVKIGGPYVAVIAGPCTVENEQQMFATARAVHEAGAVILRGGAFKPRTSPYSFQGLGEEGLKLLRAAGDELGMPVITEVTDPRLVELIHRYTDVFQIGARNMQNYTLLNEVGRSDKPVFLKRGLASSIQELLMAAEYVLNQGNERVILCERGIKTFEDSVRFTLDLSAIPVVQENSHLPLMADPSHAAGKRSLIRSLSLAAIAGGAAGIIVEVHPCPHEALCDGPQQLLPDDFKTLMTEIAAVTAALGRQLQAAPDAPVPWRKKPLRAAKGGGWTG
jgi:3-deoxy-7-phosphoheptulonate synthase